MGSHSLRPADSAQTLRALRPAKTPAQDAGDDDNNSTHVMKRRKIRKGTHSCWACKRKKTRCTFSTAAGDPISFDVLAADAVCDGCRKRGVPCISQDLPEKTVVPDGTDTSGGTNDRLVRMEALVEMLVRNGLPNNEGPSTARRDTAPSLSVRLEVPSAALGHACMTSEVDISADIRECRGSHQLAAKRTAETDRTSTSHIESCSSDAYRRQYDLLASAWPEPNDLGIVVTVLEQPSRSGLLRVLLATPSSALVAAHQPATDRTTARDILVLPPSGTRLNIVVHRLLLLASVLQHIHPCVDPLLRCLHVPCGIHMRRLILASGAVVGDNSILMHSLDGAACLTLLGVIEADQGHLRRAWLTIRRAMLLSQLLGLPRCTAAPIIPSTNTSEGLLLRMSRVLWLQIVYMDRNLSLTLGLPQATAGDAAVAFRGLRSVGTDIRQQEPIYGVNDPVNDACCQLQKIQQAHATIAGRIIERNEVWRSADEDQPSDEDNDGRGVLTHGHRSWRAVSTQAIDRALQNASRNMPMQWWATPRPGLEEGTDYADSASILLQTQRLAAQIVHYHLLMRLHLPYLLRCRPPVSRSDNGGVDGQHVVSHTVHAVAMDDHQAAYSRIACVGAGREVLSRFMRLRIGSGGRDVALLAMLAGLALCLAHLDAHQHDPAVIEVIDGLLAHQRLSDRGIVDAVAERMENMARLDVDGGDSQVHAPLLAKTAGLLRRLLDLEEAASAEVDGCRTQCQEDLCVRVPFVGIVHINKEGIRRIAHNDVGNVADNGQDHGESGTTRQQRSAAGYVFLSMLPHDASLSIEADPCAVTTEVNDWTLQGVDFAFFEDIFLRDRLGDTTHEIRTSRTPERTDDTPRPMATQSEPCVDDIPMSDSRRAGQLGDNWLWP